ncbi:MAG: DUF2330 domain-containing protein [Deltaproteobacteria bacterium]|nr:DUF2330 domain-containing protein [Deltaproteobacteria bacterium]
MRAWLLTLPMSLLVSADAWACGGLFCDGAQPVVQSGESVIFGVDEVAGEVDAIINIRYQGPPSEFAWILPLTSVPIHQAVSEGSVFATLDQVSAPRFQLTFERDESCGNGFSKSGPAFVSIAADESLAGGAPIPPRVTVLDRQQVGPYESVVLESVDAEAVREWLVTNEYFVSEQMMKLVEPYLVAGDVLMALKLHKDEEVGSIKPIWVRMKSAVACVPIRLTAIAALDDMDVTVTVLSNQGRAIPLNYLHATLNLAKIDWMNGGSNYNDVVSQAVDEGSGNAFVTELAGSARLFDGQFADAAVQALFNRYSHVTRMLTLISPEEMTIDPEFSFRSDLPDVANVHRATRRTNCNFLGSELETTIEIPESGQTLVLRDTESDQALRSRLPAALLVEQLAERQVVLDQREEVDDLLSSHNCGCAATGPGPGGELLALAALLGAAILRRPAARRASSS